MTIRAALALAALLIGGAPALGQSIGRPVRPLLPIVKVENEPVMRGIDALILSFRIMGPAMPPPVDGEQPKPNFAFVAGEGYIVGGHPTEKSVAIFPEPLREVMMAQDAGAQTCVLRELKLDDGTTGVLTVSDLDPARLDLTYACFTGALWWHTYGNLGGFQGLDWREALGTIYKHISG
ncbi:hypothetical protein [Chachezhania sediminis]|uniref:hypothetical protein n=1 Tax=Chachezhania sediminis TaxID=2599291 RepID=UPI00131D6355|nr:hypothetical protein [Chachezhania sediminis]